MSFFKKKVSVEDFCRDFYDNQILNPKIGDMEVGSAFSDVCQDPISSDTLSETSFCK